MCSVFQNCCIELQLQQLGGVLKIVSPCTLVPTVVFHYCMSVLHSMNNLAETAYQAREECENRCVLEPWFSCDLCLDIYLFIVRLGISISGVLSFTGLFSDKLFIRRNVKIAIQAQNVKIWSFGSFLGLASR